MSSHVFCVALFLFAACATARAALVDFPLNHAATVGSSVLLTCQAHDIPPSVRITWTTFASLPGGVVISDNYNITPSFPDRDRVAVITDITRTHFHLQINNVQLNDAGMYLCSDLAGLPPSRIRAYAELIVLETDPVCTDFTSITGNVVEGWSYASECLTTYKGNLAPIMEFTGPLPFAMNESITATTVWTWIRFNAASHMEGQAYQCDTYFTEHTEAEQDHATNAASYKHTYPGTTLTVVWPPRETAFDLIKPVYEIGDVLTCSSNGKPEPVYTISNYRTLTQQPGNTFTVTPDFEGWTTLMRCEARSIIEGSETIDFVNHNITVPSFTTPTTGPVTTPTTVPPANADCDDPTGRWSSTNPDATACLEMDARGNLYTLIRNGTDLFFLSGNGKTVYGDYKHIGFTGMYPDGQGTAGFVGECHKCMGVEVILLSGLKRNKQNAQECGTSAGTNLTRLYVMTRSGPPCRGMELDIANPNPAMLAKMGIRTKNRPLPK